MSRRETPYGTKLKISELQLADIVEVFEGPFGTGIVRQIDKEFVTVFRPYGTTADFSYTGGVICYTGTEEIKYPVTSKEPMKVYSRATLK